MNRKQIAAWVRRHPRMYYLYKCAKGLKNPEFVTDVNRLNDCELILNFHTYGDLNHDKNICSIKINSPYKGFFSMFCLTLDALMFADRYSLVPVVEYGNKCQFFEEETINGTNNVFEYYYEPVSDVRTDDVGKSSRVFEFIDRHRNKDYTSQFFVASSMVADDDEQSEQYIQSRAEICSKYIRLNKSTSEYMDAAMSRVLNGEKTLGVHVRGTDFKVGYYQHAKAVTEDQHMQEIDIALEKEGFTKIFVATDEADIIRKFKEKYGDRVVCFDDVYRSETGEAVHFSKDSRKNHKYFLGLEVLRDMLALSYCDGLIAGLSNVSLAARITKASRGEEYAYKKIINNGFNTTGPAFNTTKL